MLHCYICRSVNKSSVHTQLSSCQLTVRHIGDPEFRTQPFYNFNMTPEVNLAKLRLPTFSSKHTSIWFRRAEASFKNAGINIRGNPSQLRARNHTGSCPRDHSTIARYATRCPEILEAEGTDSEVLLLNNTAEIRQTAFPPRSA